MCWNRDLTMKKHEGHEEHEGGKKLEFVERLKDIHEAQLLTHMKLVRPEVLACSSISTLEG